jgi:hypothetical protein
VTATTYTIYIVNQSGMNQSFWCYPAPPQEIANDPDCDANSGAVPAVSLNNQGNANFDAPAQGAIQASDEETGLNAEIVSDAHDASLRQFDLSYLTFQFTEESPPESSPSTYYITTGSDIIPGSDGGDAPAGRDEQSSNLIAVTIPDSFQDLSCTVRFDGPGRWSKSPGAAGAPGLASERFGAPNMQRAVIVNVSWGQPSGRTIAGTLTVNVALVAAFSRFILGGISFSIANSRLGTTTFAFQYVGTLTFQAVQSLVKQGASLILT